MTDSHLESWPLCSSSTINTFSFDNNLITPAKLPFQICFYPLSFSYMPCKKVLQKMIVQKNPNGNSAKDNFHHLRLLLCVNFKFFFRVSICAENVTFSEISTLHSILFRILMMVQKSCPNWSMEKLDYLTLPIPFTAFTERLNSIAMSSILYLTSVFMHALVWSRWHSINLWAIRRIWFLYGEGNDQKSTTANPFNKETTFSIYRQKHCQLIQ